MLNREKDYIVYLHICKINKKVYVGITKHVNNPDKRFIKGRGYKHSTKFYNAILKYGWDNFEHIVLCSTSKENAILLERTLIKFYKNQKRSYNIAEGGEGSESFSKETILKLQQYIPWIKGKHHTEETRKKISESGKGRVFPPKVRQKISEATKGKKAVVSKEHIEQLKSINIKAVIQLSLDGEIIREFKSITEAEQYLNKSNHHIGSCCSGKRKTAYGYKWRYK